MAKPKAQSTKSKALSTAAPKSTALATIDQELSQEVATLKDQLSQPTGKRIKLQPTGDFILPDGTNLGNQIRVIVVDFITAHKYYPNKYNPNAIVPPDCFAYGKVIRDMKPSDESRHKENADCATCPLNAFGTGDNGRSKACKNTREIALLLDDVEGGHDPSDPNATLYTFSISPSNIKAFDGAMAAASRMVGHPLKASFSVIAKNVGTYAALTFGEIEANENYAIHAPRRAEAKPMLEIIPDYQAAAQQAKPAQRQQKAPVRRQAGAAARR